MRSFRAFEVTVNRAVRQQRAACTSWGDAEPNDDDTSSRRGVGGGFGSARSCSVASDHSDHGVSVLESNVMGIMPDFGAFEDASER